MRNLSTTLRVLIIANLVLVLAGFVLATDWPDFISQLLDLSILAQPILLASIILMYCLTPLLEKLPYRQGIIAILGLVFMVSVMMHYFFSFIFSTENLPSMLRVLIGSLLVASLLLYYFHLLHKAQSPAVAEARLQALQARIRPHFLFNSLNAVLSLIRSQPKQAETALEDMADLFRVLMADNRDLVTLAQEIALGRQYLALEKLRLNERLNVTWQIDNMPPDAMIPPLILQPLLENAVYHGIEPIAVGGTISIQIYTRLNEIHLILKNPFNAQTQHHGNKMALNNIKERLALHFDMEASLTSQQENGEYQVHITLPHHKRY